MSRDLGHALGGEVLAPEDVGFHDAISSWERSVRISPDVAVRAGSSNDIDAVLKWSRKHEVPVTCVGTGHGLVRPVVDGILLNVAALDRVALDARRRTVTTSAGTLWSDVIPAVTARGLAALWGSSSGVGVSGYTLGGGMGPFSRLHGFAADRVSEIELVTPEGGRVTVDKDREPELYWAVRGGGGAFGVARSITHHLFELRVLFGGGLYVDAREAATILEVWRGWAQTAESDVSTSLAFLSLPDLPALPPAISGRRVVHIRVAYTPKPGGNLEAKGARLVAPLRAAAPALLDTMSVMSPDQTDRIHNDPVAPLATAHRGMLLDILDDDAVAAILEIVTRSDHSGLRMVEIRRMGGALASPASPRNAVSGRSSGYHIYLTAPVDARDPDAASRSVASAELTLRPFESGSAQIGFRGPLPDAAAVLAAWPRDAADRLLTLKRRLDPRNLLRSGPALVDDDHDEKPRQREVQGRD